VPRKNDIFTGLTKILVNAGCQTVVRGFFDPTADDPFARGDYPIAAIYEFDPEIIEENSSQGSYYLKGEIQVDLYDYVDDVAGIRGGMQDQGWWKIDDLHDAVLRAFRNQFPDIFSNNVTLSADRFEMFWWLVKSQRVGGGMRVKWQIAGFA
jgi:hypothetical protein